jgi:hypothetical protein
MKTEHLIQAMAADTTRPRPVEQVLPLALGAAAVLAGALFLAAMGVRVDLGAALGELRVLVKHAFPILLAVAALGLSVRLARPGATPGIWSRALLVAPSLALLAFVVTAIATPASVWGPTMVNPSMATCLTMIPLVGLPILGASILALRRGASTDPGRSGAVAGLLSGAVAAALYAFYCTEDSPMFWALWYSAGIALVTFAGALAGRRFLRW